MRATDILAAVQSTAIGGIDAIVERYGRWMVLHPARNVLMIRGMGCNPEVVTAVLFLSPQKSAVLAALGVERINGIQPTQLAVSGSSSRSGRRGGT